ncbi:molybdopterin dinucleotide binding domain-containing protein [Mesobacillus sp.]|uniref:molybdopterin dinucleotide binding domain-containing protein n=1 Tax=Mesobacillus sp. TaxID=2675271 RepID=UPI0039EE4E6C
MTKVASKAWKWVPIKPGNDAAFALGMIRWIIENERYDTKFLQNATRLAATNSDEPSYSNATYLVKVEKDGRAAKHLRANEIGIGTEKEFVVISNGKPAAVDPENSNLAIQGELFVDTNLEGIKVKSPLQLIKEEAYSKELAEWAELSGAKQKDIEDISKEFTSHGKKAAVEFYRGAIKHTNGWYNGQALIVLNHLIGNMNWQGGISNTGGGWSYIGDKEGQPYPMANLHPNKLSKFGVPITKEGWKYEESTLFEGYPAKRPWYPFSGNVAQETWPSISDGYPYKIKAALISSHSPMYSLPGGHVQLKTLLDTEKVPLLIASDIVIGDSSQYVDYIFPDLTYLERWATPGQSHHIRVKVNQVRQPVIAPLTENATVFGEEVPISLEALMMSISEKVGLSGFGKDAFGPGKDLNRMEDFYLKLVANIASGNKQGELVKAADSEEMELFKSSHRHLPKTVYDIEKWQQTLTSDEWKRVVYVLNRGGRFASSDDAYEGSFIKKKIPGLARLYLEEIADSRNSISGNYFTGYPKYLPIMDMAENLINDEGEFHLITNKEVFGTQSRTITNYWAQLALQPENFVVLNSVDAKKLKVDNGDKVLVTSTSNPKGEHLIAADESRPTIGKVKIVEGIRPGVVAISTHYGHWGYGARDIQIDGEVVKGEEVRGLGIHPNPLFRLDDNLRGTTLSDPIGGSASYYDTRVNIQRV